MLLSILSGGDIKSIIIELILTVPVIILALSIHETAHGYVAWRCGDNTAYNLGRLTLNPLRHLDPIGTLAMLVFGFGWAKPVPINTRNFRNPKRGMALSAAAGPIANLILGLISTVFYAFFVAFYSYAVYAELAPFLITCLNWLIVLCNFGAVINLTFAFFNLIPVPPFDGSRIALLFLPERTYFNLMRYEREIMFGILILLLVLSRIGFSPFSWLAYQTMDLVYTPVANGFWSLFRSLL